MTEEEAKTEQAAPDSTVEVYALFEGTVKRTKGKIRLPYDGCSIYFGRLKREGDSEVLGFDGYVLENASFTSAYSTVMTKDMDRFMETVSIGDLQKTEHKSLSDSVKETKMKADYVIINRLKNYGVKKTCNVKISDISVTDYREFDISEPQQKQVVDQLNVFLASDAKDFAKFIKRIKAEETEKPQKVKKKVKKTE